MSETYKPGTVGVEFREGGRSVEDHGVPRARLKHFEASNAREVREREFAQAVAEFVGDAAVSTEVVVAKTPYDSETSDNLVDAR